jgi:hypothetical protein
VWGLVQGLRARLGVGGVLWMRGWQGQCAPMLAADQRVRDGAIFEACQLTLPVCCHTYARPLAHPQPPAMPPTPPPPHHPLAVISDPSSSEAQVLEAALTALLQVGAGAEVSAQPCAQPLLRLVAYVSRQAARTASRAALTISAHHPWTSSCPALPPLRRAWPSPLPGTARAPRC